MAVFKIFQQFLLPSVFIPSIIIAGFFVFLRTKKDKVAKTFVAAGLLAYYLLSVSPFVDLFISPLENKYRLLENDDFLKAENIVFLLGMGESDVLRASEVLRIYYVNSKLKTQNLQIIISGASALNASDNPALKMKNYLSDRGVDSESISVEDKSRNTFENARNMKEIIGQEPFFLVTSGYHMPRSVEIFQKMELKPIPAPTDFKMQKNYTLIDFFPSAGNLKNADLAFHEYFGILYYRMIY